MQRPAGMSSDHHDADGKLLAAKIMGRLGGIAGGSKGGKARAQALSPERRREIALMGVRAREQKRAMKRAAKALQDQERRNVFPDFPLFLVDGEDPAPDDSYILEPGKERVSMNNGELIVSPRLELDRSSVIDPIRPNEDFFTDEQAVPHCRNPTYTSCENPVGGGRDRRSALSLTGEDYGFPAADAEIFNALSRHTILSHLEHNRGRARERPGQFSR